MSHHHPSVFTVPPPLSASLQSVLLRRDLKISTFYYMNLRTIILVLLIAFFGALVFAWQPIKAIYLTGVPANAKTSFVQIPTGASFDQVVGILKREGLIEDEKGFRWVAERMKYIKNPMRAGRFEIQPGWTNRELVTHLRGGKQAPVKIVLNNERLPEEVAGKVARFIETDSLTLLQYFNDPQMMAQAGYNKETFMSLFIPNTYEMFWNTDAKTFVERMIKENQAFWDKNGRRDKARALGLSEKEVYTLASIVERETNYNPEKPVIAGVYLNRLRTGMKLQADPTCVFATRDFATRRVTLYHTTFNSPYNTYLYKGLPPGPISMAGIPSLDAVLQAEKHEYLYFCAKPDDSGAHAFAATYAAHLVNAERFQQYLNKKGITATKTSF